MGAAGETSRQHWSLQTKVLPVKSSSCNAQELSYTDFTQALHRGDPGITQKFHTGCRQAMWR